MQAISNTARAMAASPGSSNEILIYGAIGAVAEPGEPFVTADEVIAQLNRVKGDVVVRLNSPGGVIVEGIAMFNALKRHKGRVTVYIDAMAGSIATYVMLAADKVYISRNAAIMVHSPYDIYGGSAQQLRDKADTLDRFKSTMVAAYIEKTGLSEGEVGKLLEKDTWLSADEAVAMGFVDGVIDHAMHARAFEWAAAKIETMGNVPASIANAIKGAVKMAMANAQSTAPRAETTVEEAAPPAITEEAPAVVDAADELVDEIIAAVDAGEIEASEIATIVEVVQEVAEEGLEGDERRDEIMARLAARRDAGGGAPLASSAAASAPQTQRAQTASQRSQLPAQGGMRRHARTPQARVSQPGNSRDTRIKGMRAALIERAGIGTEETAAANRGSAYRGMSIREIAAECLRAHGVDPRAFESPDKMIGRAISLRSHYTHSTSDFAEVIEGLLTVSIGKGFEGVEEVWQEWVPDDYPLPNFQEHSVVSAGPYFGVEKVPEGGTYSYGTFGTLGLPIRIHKVGSIFSITRELLLSDHLGVLTRGGVLMGEAVRENQGDEVAELLVTNPTLKDGSPIFHTSRGNIATGASSNLSMAALKKALEYFQRIPFKSPLEGDNTIKYRSVRPEYLIVPVALEWLARELVEQPTYYDGANEKANPLYNRLKVVVDGRLDASSTTSWYVAAGKNRDGIAMATLNGVKAPYTEQQEGFEVDGIKYKIRYDFGVAAIEPRTLYKGVGQA